jgi:hypothetical protein
LQRVVIRPRRPPLGRNQSFLFNCRLDIV